MNRRFKSQITGYAGVAGVAGSGRLAPEEGQDRDYDQFGDRPADKGNNGGDIEKPTRGVRDRPQDAFKRCDEAWLRLRMPAQGRCSSGIRKSARCALRFRSWIRPKMRPMILCPTSTRIGPVVRSSASVDCHSFHRALEGSGEAGHQVHRRETPPALSISSLVAAHAGREDRNPSLAS